MATGGDRIVDLRPLLLRAVRPLSETADGVQEVIARCAGARYVLIGEATHGTHEFYRLRAEITKALIEREGFCAVAIEGDWPDAHRVDRFVRASGRDTTAEGALRGFDRFPIWMWRNRDVLAFIEWLRTYNDRQPAERRARFFGLDVYSMYRSMSAVIEYLESVDPRAADVAKDRYGCFDRFGGDVERYAHAVGSHLTRSCRDEALAQLLTMQRRTLAAEAADTESDLERSFVAEQNARVVAGAEEYYRTMLDAEVSSWNLRDTFMYETLERVAAYLDASRPETAKIVVWAHNSHVGDARATTLGGGRELNIGQLARERQGRRARLIGFTTSEGTVSAASAWHGDVERKTVRAPIPGSWEALFSSIGIPNFFLDLEAATLASPALAAPLLERAIGVLYLPQTEFHSHYLYARIGEQFDALVHIERTHAVEPLDRNVRWETGEVPETYPSAL